MPRSRLAHDRDHHSRRRRGVRGAIRTLAAGLSSAFVVALLVVGWPAAGFADDEDEDPAPSEFDLGGRVKRELPEPVPTDFDLGDRVEDPDLRPLAMPSSSDFVLEQREERVERSLRIEGFVDLGFFVPIGDGAGHIQDSGNRLFPSLAGRQWVFVGDPLSTAVNARNEPADLGDASNRSRAIERDVIDSRGEPRALVNEIDVDVLATLTGSLVGFASVNIVPRQVSVDSSAFLDVTTLLDVDRAFLEWTPIATRHFRIAVSAGRFAGVIGQEYREHDAIDRFGVTPSLLYRYLGGSPTGIKARMGFLADTLRLNLALTDRSAFLEIFRLGGTQNPVPRVGSGRIAYTVDLLGGIEVGASGLVGVQEGQGDADVVQWQVGGDLSLWVWRFEVLAEYLRGRAVGKNSPGAPSCAAAECIEFEAVSGTVRYFALSWLGVFVRVDWRDALHEKGDDFVYVSNLVRYTMGARVELGERTTFTLEYVHADEIDDELGSIPDFDNDVFTSSLTFEF